MNRAHIITCLDNNEYTSFINEGFAGLFPIKVDEEKVDNSRALGAKIGTNWDIIADLKRVKPNDYIFLHTKGEGKVYGPFQATTYFLEHPEMPACFKSENLNIEYWIDNYEDCDFEEYPWRVGIKSIEGATGSVGINSMELFKLKSVGLIQSLPDRFLYHDKPKIVKPLLTNETAIILKLLREVNNAPNLTVTSADLSTYHKIRLNLNPHNGGVYREKILEAWLMENVTFNGDNQIAFDNVRAIFGQPNHFCNSVYTYYTNFLDVLFYNSLINSDEPEVCPNCNKYTSKDKTTIYVVELKTGWATEAALWQIKEYGDWALKSLANNEDENLKLCIVATGFSDELINSEDENLMLVKYELSTAAPNLVLTRIR